MTIQRLKIPAAWAVAALLLAALLEFVLPPKAVIIVRFANGFCILVLVIWIVQRVLEMRILLLELMCLVRAAEANRSQAVVALQRQAAEVAQRLEVVTAQRATEHLEKLQAIQATTEQTRAAVASDAIHAQTETIVAKIEEGAASARAAEHAANDVNRKIEDINQRLIEKDERSSKA